MDVTNHLGATVAWCGFALGLVFGAVGNKANFCTMGAVSDIVNMGDWGRMRMWLLAIAVAIAGSYGLWQAGIVDLSKSIYTAPNFMWLSFIVGGFLFTQFGAVGVTGFNLYSMLVAVIGAVVVLVIYHALFGRR